MYEYRARVLDLNMDNIADIVDGDTFYVEVDQGLDNTRKLTLRLFGVDAPEKNRAATKAAGLAAKAYVEQWFAEHTPDGWFHVTTILDRSDSFRRYLAIVRSMDLQACLNDDLILSGHAVAKTYR